jgi:hypothetical protein
MISPVPVTQASNCSRQQRASLRVVMLGNQRTREEQQRIPHVSARVRATRDWLHDP